MGSIGECLVTALLHFSRSTEGLSSSLELQQKINRLQQANQLEKWIVQQRLSLLTGSINQIRWAQAIRLKILKHIIIRLMRAQRTTVDPLSVAQHLDKLFSHTTASFWIMQSQEPAKKFFKIALKLKGLAR